MLYYGTSLLTARIAALESITPFYTGAILIVGDSIPAGTQSNGYSWPGHLGFPATVTINNTYSIAGHEVTQTTADLPSGGYASLFTPSSSSIALFERATNDIGNSGKTGINTYAAQQLEIQKAKAAGFYTAIFTLLPRGTSGPFAWDATKDGYRTDYNNAVRLNSAGADLIVDLAADPVMGASTAPYNTALYLDQLHPTNAGQDLLASIIRKAIAPLLNGVLRSPTTPAVAINYLRINNLNNLTETALLGGFDYTTASVHDGYSAPTATGYSNAKLPASTDGWFGIVMSGMGPNGPIMGFSTSSTPASFSDCTAAIFADANSVQNGNDGQHYTVINGGLVAASALTNSVLVQSGDICRARRAGSTLYFEISKDSGTTYIVVYSTPISTAQLTPFVQTSTSAANGRIGAPRCSTSVQ